MDQTMLLIIPLLAGWILDSAFGDPEGLPHPIVWYGKAISFFEKRLNRGRHLTAKGAFTAIFLILMVFIIGWALMILLHGEPLLLGAVATVVVFYCLAGATLVKEVAMVFQAVSRSVEDGRRQVARIVGRDTSELTPQEIRTAALETLAENLSDGVVAPIFWYVLLGFPGMLAYKMVNTLDSMIAYKTPRYKQFGRVSAKIDDIANYIPARITAMLILIAGHGLGKFSFVKRYARCHASPNSGWPEAALASLLDCRFGGTHTYFGEEVYKPYIGENDRKLTDEDCSRGIGICRRAETMALLLAVVALAIIGMVAAGSGAFSAV